MFVYVSCDLLFTSSGPRDAEVPAVGESGRPRERGFADGATESETWCWKTGETGGCGKTGETFKEKTWMFHEKIRRFDPSGASEIVFFRKSAIEAFGFKENGKGWSKQMLFSCVF